MAPYRATVDDLYRVPDKAELVDGGLVRMTPSGALHGYVVMEIAASLREYARSTGRGVAFGDNVGFLVNLQHRRSFSPDAAFWTGGPIDEDFLEGAPVFAVEVRSEEDFGPIAERRLAAKRQDYFEAGTLVVWDVDPIEALVVRAYRASDPDRPAIYRRGDLAEASPAVPGWTLPIDTLCPPDRR